MSDIGFQGAADVFAVLIGMALLMSLTAAIPIAIWGLEATGVKISPSVHTSANRLVIAFFIGAVCLLMYLPVVWS